MIEPASVIIQTAFLGDTILTTPLIAELATRGPVDVVTTPAAAPLLANNPGIRRLLTYDKRGSRKGIGGLFRMARDIRRPEGASPTTAYLAQGSLRSAALAAMAGIRERVGFATSPGRLLYTRSVPFRDDLHHAERLLHLALRDRPSDALPSERLRPRLYPGSDESRAVDSFLAGHQIDGPFVAIAPGSIWPTKRWPYYAELAWRVAEPWPVVLVGGPGDAAEADRIVAGSTRGRVVSAIGQLSLLASVELIRRARALVTNDSAPLHMASATQTPTIAIFGPTVPEFGFGPLARQSSTVGHGGLDCRPCDRHGPRRCPLGHWRCMREVAPDRVFALLTSITD